MSEWSKLSNVISRSNSESMDSFIVVLPPWILVNGFGDYIMFVNIVTVQFASQLDQG